MLMISRQEHVSIQFGAVRLNKSVIINYSGIAVRLCNVFSAI